MTGEHVIVDGYNVVFRTPRLREQAADSLERARDELLRWLEEAFRNQRARVTLVFDGARDIAPGSGRRRRGAVRVIYSEPPASADDVIRRLVDEQAAQRLRRGRLACRVVTSDLEVARYARLSGGKAIDVEAFLPELEAMRTAAPPLADARPPSAPRAARAKRPPTQAPDPSLDPSVPRLTGRRELDRMERLFRQAHQRDGDDDLGDEPDDEPGDDQGAR